MSGIDDMGYGIASGCLKWVAAIIVVVVLVTAIIVKC